MSKDPIIKNVVQAERVGFSRRLREALTAAGHGEWNATQLASGMNGESSQTVSYAAVRKWLISEAIPTQRHLVTLSQLLACDPHWLRYGTRELWPFDLAEAAPDPVLLDEIAGLDAQSKRLVRILVDAITAFSH